MPGLKFIITGDDSPLRATLAKVAKDTANGRYEVTSGAKESLKVVNEERAARLANYQAIIKENNAIRAQNTEKLANTYKNNAAGIKRFSSPVEVSNPIPGQSSVAETGIQAAAKLQAQLESLKIEILSLAAAFDAGEVSEDVFADKMRKLANANLELNDRLNQVNNSFSKGAVVQAENAAATEAGAAATKASSNATAEQIGKIEALKTTLKQLQAAKFKLLDSASIAATNAEIEAVKAELKTLDVVGTTGFTGINGAADKPIGKLERLQYVAKLYEQQAKTSFNPDIITKYNKKLQETELAITRTKNMGKDGFDSLGNAVAKSGNYLSMAWSWIRKIAYALPGIGVAGLIGFFAGPIIEWVGALLKGSDALSTAKLRLQAFSEALKSTEFSKAIENIMALKVNLDLVKEGFIDKNGVIDEYNATIGKTSGYVDTLNQAEKGIIKNADNYIRVTLLKAAAQQVLADSAKDAVDTAEKNLKLQDKIAELQETKKTVQKESKNNPNAFGGDARGVITAADKDIVSYTKEIEENNKKLETANKRRIQILTDVDKQAIKGGVPPAGISEGTSQRLELENKLANDTLEKNKLLAENTLNDDKQTYAKRLAAINDFYAASKGIAENNEKLGLSDKKLSKDQRLHIENEYNNTVLGLQKTREQQLKSLNQKANKVDQATALLESQTSLLEKSDALKAKYAAKDKTRNDQAVDDIKADFKAQYDAIVAHNVKYQAYLKTHTATQATAKGLKYIDPASLKPVEDAAVAGERARQTLEDSKVEIEKQKAIFQEYQDFKLKAGSETADKLYGNELKGYKTFIEYLTSLKPTEAELNSSNPEEKAYATHLKDYLDKALPEAQLDEYKKTQAHLQELLLQNQDYEQQRKTLIQNSNDDIALLIKAGDTAGANQAKKSLSERLDALGEENFKELDAYKDLYNNIDTLSTEAAKKEIAKLYTYAAISLATGKISIQAYTQIIKTIRGFGVAVDENGLPGKLKLIGSELQNWSSMLSGFDDELSKVLGTAGKLVSAVGSIKSDLKTLNANSGGTPLQKISAGLGLVGTAIGVVTTIVGLFSNAKAKAEQLQYSNDLQLKAVEAINKALERQLNLTKQIYGPERITAYLKGLADIKAAQENAESQLTNRLELTGIKAVDDEIAKYNNGQKYNRWLLPANLIDKITKSSNLAGKSVEDLQKLLDNGKLDTQTAAIAQSLIDLQQQAIDTQNALTEDLTGTSFDSLLDGVVQTFQDVNSTAADGMANFQKIIQTGLLNSFKRDYLEKQLQGFYDDLYKLTNSHADKTLTSDDITKLQDEYNTIIKNAGDQFKNIQAATGISLTDADTSSALNKSISSITSDQANALEGITRGQYDYTKKIYDLQLQGNGELASQRQTVMAGLNNLIAIQTNTANTVIRLDTAIVALNNIVANTKPTSLRGAGLG